MHYIYAITNTQTGDVYIGQARWLSKRFSTHRCTLRRGKHCNRYLQRSYNKYGEAVFKYAKLEECVNLDLANERESAIIADYRARDLTVYNLRDGGPNTKMTDDHSRRISEAHKGRRKTDEHRRRIPETNIGRKQSPETIAKRVAARASYVFTTEHRQKLSEAMTGKKWTEEQKAKVRGRVMSPEARAKMSAAKMGKPWSEERRNVSGHLGKAL